MYHLISLKKQHQPAFVIAKHNQQALAINTLSDGPVTLVGLMQAAHKQQQSLTQWCDAYWQLHQTKVHPFDDLLRHVSPAALFPPDQTILVSGTGLTHLGSQQSRNSMHATQTDNETDSAKMFRWGVEGGKPQSGMRGVAPEWFYKGDGSILKGPEESLTIPRFTADGGEEPEIASLYWNDQSGEPHHLGFVLGNEWSDHHTEKQNYLYLAPSKLRDCAIGNELLIGHPFDDLTLQCTVTRNGEVVYDSGELLTGENSMCHSLANCEDHHFKHRQHRHPGQCHVHFLGTSKLSYGVREWNYQHGDVITVSSPEFLLPLSNPIEREEPSETPFVVKR